MSQSTRAHAWRAALGTLALSCLVAGLGGCSKKDEKKESAKSTTIEQSDTTDTPAAVKPPVPDVPDEQVPTEEDYEDQVEKQIKPESNLPAELDKIEKEIAN